MTTEEPEIPAFPDLQDHEQIALVGLVRHLIEADGEVSNTELYDLVEVGAELGEEVFGQALAMTEAVRTDREAALKLASTVVRVPIQQGILAILNMVAEGDGVHLTEIEFIDTLREHWA